MPLRRSTRHRTPLKQQRIISSLRHEIVVGAYPPGSQLPTRDLLEQRYGASRVTIQRVLDKLAEDGFACARGRHGTFVTDRPPHLHRYGLLFHWRPASLAEWPRFWQALRQEAEQLSSADGPQIEIYYGPQGPPDESYLRLAHDLHAQRLAGLVFSSNPGHLRGTPILEQPGVPCVAIMPRHDFSGVAAVDLPPEAFLRRAVEYLHRRGRRRIACILGRHGQAERELLLEEFRRRNLSHRPYWVQQVSPELPEAARELTHLLLHVGQAERPDGLIIADDNSVEHATAGLVASGTRVPDDLEIVAHCNFPCAAPSAVPMKRLGFDAGEVLRACLAQLVEQRQGASAQTTLRIEARFEEELLPAVRVAPAPIPNTSPVTGPSA